MTLENAGELSPLTENLLKAREPCQVEANRFQKAVCASVYVSLLPTISFRKCFFSHTQSFYQTQNGSSSSSNEDEIEYAACEQLEDETQKCQQLLQDLRSRRKALAEEIRQLKQRTKTLEIKLPKLSMEIEGFDTTRTDLTRIIPELNAQCELSVTEAAELLELNKIVTRCKADMASCVIQATKLEAAVDRLQKAIVDAGGPKLKKQQEKCEKTLSELSDAQKRLNTAQVTIASCKKVLEKSSKVRDAAALKLEEMQSKLEEKKVAKESLETDAREMVVHYDAVMDLEKEKRRELDQIQTELEELRATQSESKSIELDFLSKIEERTKLVAESEKKLKQWAKAIEKLRKAMEEDDDDDSDDESDEETVKESTAAAADDMSIEVDGSDASNSPSGDDSDVVMDSEKELEVVGQKGSLPTFSFAALKKYSKRQIKEELEILVCERNTISKNANMGAIAEYKKKEADYLLR